MSQVNITALCGCLDAVNRDDISGAETPFTEMARFRDGQMTDYKDFGDGAEALAAAGLGD